MSFRKKNSNNHNTGNEKLTVLTSSLSHSVIDAAVGSHQENVAANGFSSSPSQNKTPRKSGLTPVRPTKSPGTGMKHKSGLTPVRPGVSQGTSKSPFTQKTRLKSGLAPIKPIMQGAQQGNELKNCPTFNTRRKSGLQPIRPAGMLLSTFPSQIKTDITVLESKSVCFVAPQQRRGIMSFSSAPQNALLEGRRKSGLVPIKPSQFRDVPPDRHPQWKSKPSILNLDSQRLPQNKIKQPIDATPSLNSITEDSENNVSGIIPLDDSQDMSVVIRPKAGQRLSRIPLPRTTLNNAHFISSSDITQSRIPKRVLYFPDEDEIKSHPNILKDGSSKVNMMEETCVDYSLQNSDGLLTLEKPKSDHSYNNGGKETLLQRKREIENAMKTMSTELNIIDEQLCALGEKELLESTNRCENLNDKDVHESDSPFAQVGSPVFSVPLKHLTLAKSKQADNMYDCFRESCSFLKTPQHSAFARPRDPLRLAQLSEESPNVSQRVQKQLADLFARDT